MTRPTKSAARTEMMYTLERLQADLEARWIDKGLPDNWTGMDAIDPIDPHTTRVTLRLDTDMLSWFRKLGPGYQRRLNRVLRVYWLALSCGHVHAYDGDDPMPRIQASLLKMRRQWEGDE